MTNGRQVALDLRLRKTTGSGRDFAELKSMICLKGTGAPVLQPTLAMNKCRFSVESSGVGAWMGGSVCGCVLRIHKL